MEQCDNNWMCGTDGRPAQSAGKFGVNIIAQSGSTVCVPNFHNVQATDGIHFRQNPGASTTAQSSMRAETGRTVNTPQISCHFSEARKHEICNRLRECTKTRYETIYEGTSDEGNRKRLPDIYTELYIVEGHTGGVSHEHEVWQIEAMSRTITADTPVMFNNIFEDYLNSQNQRTVLTLGIAGVGKTMSVKKFALDWAEGKHNKELDFVFLMPFRDLNPIMAESYSLFELLCYFYHIDLKIEDVRALDDCNVLFVFDGLDEICHMLKVRNNKMVCDVTKQSSVELLIINLITGSMLPSARIWITSRPAAAHQIPNEFIHLVTEVRGFSDEQKDEYFRKIIADQEEAEKIISHIKKSRSLHIMCHIPVFCWISATVLQQMLPQKADNAEMSTTITEMYTNFLLYQIDQNHQKYPVRYDGNPKKDADCAGEILKLAELAYKNLMREKLIFQENDLQECGIDVQAASVYSWMFTEIFKEEKTLFRSRAFSFVHLSLQEFLAALYVFYMYSSKGINVLLQTNVDKFKWQIKNSLCDLHKSAIKKSLESQTGHLDLFLRFLLGISQQSNQTLLNKIVQKPCFEGGVEKTVQFIKEKIRDKISPERSINLLHCFNEMNDTSLVEEIKIYMKSKLEHQLSPAQCSALVYLLLISKEDVDEFD